MNGRIVPYSGLPHLSVPLLYPKLFRSLGLTTRLHEENIGQETILEIERRFNERGVKYGENGNVTGAVARKILETAL